MADILGYGVLKWNIILCFILRLHVDSGFHVVYLYVYLLPPPPRPSI